MDLEQFLKKNWRVLLFAAAGIAFFLWVRKELTKLAPLQLQQGGGEVNTGPGGGVDMSLYKRYATEIRNALIGFDVTTTYTDQVYARIMSLNDNELRLVANAYEQLFSNEEYPTLRQVISQEIATTWGELWGSDWGTQKTEILNRLDSIGA